MLCIVGAFLIANSTLFEHPRSLVARYFGRSYGRLQSVREYVYNRVQTTLGFAFLLAGFGLQLIGQFRTAGPEGPPLNMVWVGVIVAAAIALLFSGWWLSVWAFRRYVREYFTHNPRTSAPSPTWPVRSATSSAWSQRDGRGGLRRPSDSGDGAAPTDLRRSGRPLSGVVSPSGDRAPSRGLRPRGGKGDLSRRGCHRG